jgi:glycosyltransferase involved in cell wall biosynthesis
MRIGIDYTAAVRQGAGIGRYVRGLIGALPALDRENQYRLFVAGRGVVVQTPIGPNFRACVAPLTDRETSLLWQRMRLPVPIELWLGPLDVFHSPDFVLPPVLHGRTVLTVHDLSFLRVPECAHPILRQYLEKVVPRSVRRADLVLADSACTRDDVIELLHVPAERVRVVYAGVDPRLERVTDEAHLAQVRERYGLNRPFVLCLSTLEPRKNYVGLVRAFALLVQRLKLPHKLAIVGGRGWLYEPIFAEVREQHLEERVMFLGHAADDDLPAILSAADCLCYPSFYEGFGIPVLEAMACGTAVVTTSASSLPEVAGQAAVYVDPHDVESIADGLQRVLTDAELRARLQAMGPEQSRRFTWERAGRTLLEAYRWAMGAQ